jgi:hypothetical protein
MINLHQRDIDRGSSVYCSAATKEMLLQLERYPCRINYAKGILEARVQTYKHLKNLLVAHSNAHGSENLAD